MLTPFFMLLLLLLLLVGTVVWVDLGLVRSCGCRLRHCIQSARVSISSATARSTATAAAAAVAVASAAVVAVGVVGVAGGIGSCRGGGGGRGRCACGVGCVCMRGRVCLVAIPTRLSVPLALPPLLSGLDLVQQGGEVRVLQRILGRQARVGVVLEQLSGEVEGCRGRACHALLQAGVCWRDAVRGDVAAVVAKARVILHAELARVWQPEHTQDEQQLLQGGVALAHGMAVEHLCSGF